MTPRFVVLITCCVGALQHPNFRLVWAITPESGLVVVCPPLCADAIVPSLAESMYGTTAVETKVSAEPFRWTQRGRLGRGDD